MAAAEHLVHVQRITRDSADRLWISTGGDGLLRWGPDSRGKGDSRWFRTQDGLPHDIVYALAEDDNGNMWVTTRRGLARVRGDHVDNLAEIAGLPRRSPVQMQLDGMGALWVNDNDGIFRIPLTELIAAADGRAKVVPTRVFTTVDGLRSVDVSLALLGPGPHRRRPTLVRDLARAVGDRAARRRRPHRSIPRQSASRR